MKRVTIFAIAVMFATLLVSCGNSADEATVNAVDTTAVAVDTTAVATDSATLVKDTTSIAEPKK